MVVGEESGDHGGLLMLLHLRGGGVEFILPELRGSSRMFILSDGCLLLFLILAIRKRLLLMRVMHIPI